MAGLTNTFITMKVREGYKSWDYDGVTRRLFDSELTQGTKRGTPERDVATSISIGIDGEGLVEIVCLIHLMVLRRVIGEKFRRRAGRVWKAVPDDKRFETSQSLLGHCVKRLAKDLRELGADPSDVLARANARISNEALAHLMDG